MRTRDLRSLTSLAAGLGLLVAIFAAAEFFDASLRGVCSINSFFSCALVDESGRTSTLGIPDYLWGIGGFVAILVVAALAERNDDDVRWAYALVFFTTGGVAFAFYFLYVELALIHALCIVCAADYILGGIAWAGALALAMRTRRGRSDEPTDEPAGAPS
jgi:uncharacterized membrane protein